MKVESIPGDGCVKAFPPSGELAYIPDFINSSRADELFSILMEETAWESRTINMFGKRIMQPRRIAFQGNPGISYSYSGGVYSADPWQAGLIPLLEAIEREAASSFNCALLNLYRDGRDSMGWHSDDEAELGSCPTIASVSLGASRRFVLRQKIDKKIRVEIEPSHGSLIIMRGDLQHHWQHALPKTARETSARINLTFREIARLRQAESNQIP